MWDTADPCGVPNIDRRSRRSPALPHAHRWQANLCQCCYQRSTPILQVSHIVAVVVYILLHIYIHALIVTHDGANYPPLAALSYSFCRVLPYYALHSSPTGHRKTPFAIFSLHIFDLRPNTLRVAARRPPTDRPFIPAMLTCRIGEQRLCVNALP